MPERLIVSSRKNPCPVCNRTKDGDCRISQDSNLVLCHTELSKRTPDEILNGYIWIGEVTEPLNWGKWLIPSSEPRKNPDYRPTDREFRFDYTDELGKILTRKVRIYYQEPDGSTRKRDWWEPKGVDSALLLPYRYLQAIEALKADPDLLLFIDESEMTADELWKMGLPAIAFGRSLSTARIRQLLSGFESRLVICQDQDQVGVQKAAKYLNLFPMAATLRPYPQSDFWMPEWLPAKGGLDVRDWILEGELTASQVLAAIEQPLRLSNAPGSDFDNPAEKRPKLTAGDHLLKLAQQATYFHTSDQVAYADIYINGSRHTYAVRSRAFRLWLSGEYFQHQGKGISSQTLQDTLNTLEAIAIFKGETREVHLRVTEYQDKIYLDLGTPDWKAAEISATGWQIVSDYPVRFWRPESLLSLPYPEVGGSLEELRELLNVDGSAWTLLITFLLFCFCPGKTYPVLMLSAHRGSGKTAAAEILKKLIDPGKAPLIKPTNDTHKLAVAASRRWLMAYDNVSHISPEQSDDFCRLATGFGYSTRTLHTTDEETTFEFTRPQIITAIDALVTRDDLADRVLMVQLPEIPEDKRLPQAELMAKVEAARPRILGALLTALSQTMAELPHTKPEKLPRMADYALFAIAAEKALGLQNGQFRETFDESREQSRQVVIESSPIGEAVLRLMRDRLVWKGTASDLLNELEQHTEESTVRSRYWPKASNIFKRQLNRLAPDLKALGIEVTEFRQGRECTRIIVLEKALKVSSVSSANEVQSLELSQGKAFNADDTADDMQTILSYADDTANKVKSLEPIQSKTFDADDTCPADDTTDDNQSLGGSAIADDTADDTCPADDMQTILKNNIVCAESITEKAFQSCADDADDTDDKKTPSFKWMYWKKIDTQVEVLESKGNQSKIRVPGQQQLQWVFRSELREVT